MTMTPTGTARLSEEPGTGDCGSNRKDTKEDGGGAGEKHHIEYTNQHPQGESLSPRSLVLQLHKKKCYKYCNAKLLCN